MFNKYLKSIAYNPSAINNFSYYAGRLKKEQSIRRLGLFFIIMTMFVQIFASLVPAERSYAAAQDNDIVKNGFTTRKDLLAKYDASAELQGIYRKFGIERANIAAGTETYQNLVATGRDYWSIGRNPLSAYGRSSEENGELKLNAGGTTVYQRPLKAWGNITERALKLTVNNREVWIIQSCGNLVTIGAYTPQQPRLEVKKELFETPETVKPGDTVKYRIYYRNAVDESIAKDFRLRDLLPDDLQYVGMDGAEPRNFIDGDPVNNIPFLGGTAEFKVVTLVAKVKPSATGRICNVARVSADVAGTVESPKTAACVTIAITPTPTPPTPVTPTPPNPVTPPPVTPKCTVPGKTDLPVDDVNCKIDEADGSCIASTGFLENSNVDFKVKTTSTVIGTTKVAGYVYTLDNPASGGSVRNVASSSTTDEQVFKDLKPGLHKVVVTVALSNNTKSASKTCETEIDVAETPQVAKSKLATKDGVDINNKTVKPGDTIQFKLTTKNITNSDYNKYVGEDYFGDVLNYADIVDQAELANQGMTLGTDKYLRWETASIKKKTEDVKVITVKMKALTPSTNAPASTSTEFDCVISNKYGNQVSMNVDCPLIKKVEIVNGTLPNTGPGTTLGLTFLITVISGYFFARARLLAKESGIIRRIYQQTSGGI